MIRLLSLMQSNSRIWVARYAQAQHHPDLVNRLVEYGWPNVNWLEPTVYDVLDPRGKYLGSATFPPGAEIKYARGANVWLVEQGEFDEHYVARYVVTALGGAD